MSITEFADKWDVSTILSWMYRFTMEAEMYGRKSLIRKNVPPYVKAAREPLSYAGINSIGLRRRGFDNEAILNIEDIYRIIYVRSIKTRYKDLAIC